MVAKKNELDRRRCIVGLRLTQAERRELHQEAMRLKMRVSELIRHRIFVSARNDIRAQPVEQNAPEENFTNP